MPIYEFRCPKCHLSSEQILSKVFDNKEERVACPLCRIPMVLQVSASSFRLKGEGWAKDGYQKGRKK